MSLSRSTATQSSYLETVYATRFMNSTRMTGMLARIIANIGYGSGWSKIICGSKSTPASMDRFV